MMWVGGWDWTGGEPLPSIISQNSSPWDLKATPYSHRGRREGGGVDGPPPLQLGLISVLSQYFERIPLLVESL